MRIPALGSVALLLLLLATSLAPAQAAEPPRLAESRPWARSDLPYRIGVEVDPNSVLAANTPVSQEVDFGAALDSAEEPTATCRKVEVRR
jgi:hypothetical protein